MKDKDRDIMDDLIRSKLYDFEMDTASEDWEMIANRLPAGKSIPMRKTARFWGAAAVIVLLMTMGGIYFFDTEQIVPQITQEIHRQTEEIDSRSIEDSEKMAVQQNEQFIPVEPNTIAYIEKTIESDNRGVFSLVKKQKTMDDKPAKVSEDEGMISKAANDDDNVEKDAAIESPSIIMQSTAPLIADAAPVQKTTQKTSSRKWGFGMGAGGMSVGSNNIVPNYVTNAMGLRSESLLLMNAAAESKELPKTDIKHKTPVSFGLGVNRYINDRFALQTGLTYTFLSSKWTTNGIYHTKSQQSLHFIGIPVSLTYKIAEWNRFNFYTSAGGMVEKNVSGTLRSQLYKEGEDVSRLKENKRMKELLWSLNARAGVSYPIIRFVSAFAEVGAGYYFDNGSEVETIHSEKPFNVNLQFGLRLGL